MRSFQVLIFLALLFGVDYTPLNAERIVAYFHLGTFGAFLFAAIGILVLWQVSKIVLGLALLVLGIVSIAIDKWKAKPKEVATRARKRILVSHEEAVNEVIEEILCSAGYEVKTTTYPSEVLALVRDFAPDFALIKLVAPEIDGLDLSEQLAKRFPKVKVVLVGPFCDLEWTRKYLQGRGINCKFLDAPFNRNELLDIVASDGLFVTEVDWDTLFETTPDDSEIFLCIDPDQFRSDNSYGHFEIGFRKISFGRKPRFPDYESCFRGLVFSCQWDSDVPTAQTYAWNLIYRNASDVGLKRAQRMSEMLGKIQKIEQSLPSRPRSFGEYVAAMANGLGFKSDVMAFRKGYDSVETQSVSGSYLPLNRLELQDFVNQLIAKRRQSQQNKRAPDALAVTADSGEVYRRMSNRDEIRQLGLAVSNGLTEYIEVHNKIFQESATFKSVVKNLFGRGASMSQLLDDSKRLVLLWAAIHEKLEGFRRTSYLSLTPDERSYFDLLSRYARAIEETVRALVERQRLLDERSRLGRNNTSTWELFQDKERLYRSAVAQYVLIGRELNTVAPIIFD